MPLLFLSAAFLVGIVLGKYVPLPWWVWGIGGLFFLLLTFINPVLRRYFRFWQHVYQFFHFAPGLVFVVFFLGAVRFLIATPPIAESDLARYNDRGEFVLVGVVSAPPEVINDLVRYEISFTEITDPQYVGLFNCNKNYLQ